MPSPIRRLLLMMLTLLFPLQLFAATVEHLSQAAQTDQAQQMSITPSGAERFAAIDAAASADPLQVFSQSGEGSPPAADEDDGGSLKAQGDLEDQTLPAQSATPALCWQSFPHSFPVPDAFASSSLGLLRPPPLA
ncbi:hypothetical protein PQR62_04870 [Herbaspirillum lusitanum]|uniref:Uncharacterized protein n=1 Tax=Herbaspirillum lusitanum TaxID=213312 RepID=A0ABW9A7D3_9BURK